MRTVDGRLALVATIAICPKPEKGHLNPALGLAKRLRARGHHVLVFVPASLTSDIAAAGFEPVQSSDALVVQFLWPLPEPEPPQGQPWDPSLATRYRAARAASFDLLRSGRVWQPFNGHAVDLFIVDVSWTDLGLSAIGHLDAPAVQYSPSLLASNLSAPPLNSGLREYGWGLDALLRRWEWFRYGKRALPSRLAVELGLTGRLTQRCDLYARIELPTLVLCPSAFDFARTALPVSVHAGAPCVDVDRREVPLDWGPMTRDPDKPLVYCSLGSWVELSEGAARFFAIALRVMARHPEWQMVVAVGKRELAVADIPANVRVCKHAPQLALLQQADAAIIHGGLNSIKECIWFGVPMLVYPWAGDMFGNAARVASHGLGMRTDLSDLTERGMEAQLKRVLGDRSYTARVAQMRAAFHAADASTEDMEWVERQLSGQPSPSDGARR